MTTLINNSLAFKSQIPELFLAFSILLQLIFNTYWRNKNVSSHYYLNNSVSIQTFFILICLLFLVFNSSLNNSYTSFLLINTEGTQLVKLLIVFFSVLALGPISQAFNLQKLNFFEFYTLFLFSILASLLLISASDFLTVYLLIEMQALCFYVLASFRKKSVFSSEAGLKYFIFGSIISCIYLIGVSLLYGCVGTLNFNDLKLIFLFFPFSEAFDGINHLVIISLILICITFLFKLGVAPFHFWVPDVYEGAPISSTITFSFLPKIVFFDLLIKFSKIFGVAFQYIDTLFIVVGLISVAVGAFLALKETRLKRFIIYSSISQIGFPVVLLSSSNLDSMSSIYFFIIIYTLTAIVMWGGYVFLYEFSIKNLNFDENCTNKPIYISDLTGLFLFDNVWSFFFLLIFFALAGLPPLSGFLGKFIAVLSLVQENKIISGTILVFLASVSTFYYVKIIKMIFFEKKNQNNFKFIYVSNQTDYLSHYNCLVCVTILIILVHSFFFLDFWLLLSKYIYSCSFF